MFRSPSLRLACLPLLCAPLLAEDEPLRFGLQATVAAPRQEFREVTGKAGMGGGFFFEQDLEGGWSLRTRVDYLAFGEEPSRSQQRLASFVPPTALRVAANQASVGVELRLRPARLQGAFFLGGAFGTRMEFTTIRPSDVLDQNGIPLPGQVRAKEKTPFKLGLAAGAGYHFSPDFSITLRYTAVNLTGATLATVEGGLDYRF